MMLCTTKLGEVLTKLLPHQQRVVDRIQQEDQPGLVVAHGLGSGKCVRGNTLIWTDKGLVPIHSLFAKDEIQLESGNDRTLPPTEHRIASLVEGRLVWQPLVARYCQKLSDLEPTYIVKTALGLEVEATGAHPLLIVRNGELTWVSINSLVVGDFLVVPEYLPAPRTEPVPEALVDLLTWQVAEGWEGKKSTAVITQQDVRVLLHLQDCFRHLFPGSTSGHIRTSTKGIFYIEVSCKEYRTLLESGGYVWGKRSARKALPPWFLLLPEDLLSRGLRNLFDAEGSVGVSSVELVSASRRLIEQIQYALLRLGIRSSFKPKKGMATNGSRVLRTYYRLSVSGEDAAVFLAKVGFGIGYKQISLEKLVNKKRNTNNGIPALWLFESLKSVGLGQKHLLVTKNKGSLSAASCLKVISKLRWLASKEAIEHYETQSSRLGGTAKYFSSRTLDSIRVNSALLLSCADRLENLVKAPVRYFRIEEIRFGHCGGIVYDLVVKSDKYDNRNYIGGAGGLLLHNTLSSIAAQDALGKPSTVVVPASLQANYRKELEKHTKDHPPAHVESLQLVTRRGEPTPNPLLVVDEAHRVRDPSSKGYEALSKSDFEKRLLLTGSPFYNHPVDIAPLINLAAGQKVLPQDKGTFSDQFISERQVSPGFWAKLKGIKPGVVEELNDKKLPLLKEIFGKWVDYHPNSTEGFPEVRREDVKVPMTRDQTKMYDTLLDEAPPWVASKIKSGLPPSKQESKDLNAFMSAVRQVSNSTAGFQTSGSAHDPKIEEAYKRLSKLLVSDPEARAVVYSNYLDSGIYPYKQRLEAGHIPYGEFTGEMSKKERDALVQQYNEGKIRALLLSSAGGEGLDLKGTRLLQVLEPHWNLEKIKQVEGRGIRYKSHEGLSPEKQNVLVERYLATRPKMGILERLGLSKPGGSVDEYLAMLSHDKENLIEQFRKVMEEHEA